MFHRYHSTCKWWTYLLLAFLGVVLLINYIYKPTEIVSPDILKLKMVSGLQKYNDNPDITTKDQIMIQTLTLDLEHKLNLVIPQTDVIIPETCKTEKSIERSCNTDTGCLQLGLPESLRSRVEQIVNPPQLHYNSTYQQVFEDMANSVPGYFDVIIATGASSNHYKESLALLYNLRKFVYPNLKNFTLIYYDLGLTEEQRQSISEECQCHVRSFPFSRFPNILSNLKCYAWKPMIINAHVSRANILHWVDASIRFRANFTKLETLYRRARAYGLQTGSVGNRMAPVTLKSMFHFFGDEPCSYHYYKTLTASILIFNNERFIREAVIKPWSACALDEKCMCPHMQVNLQNAVLCSPVTRNRPVNEYEYGSCHRFDQSALTIIMRKLFQEKSVHLLRPDIGHYISIMRGDHVLVT